MTSLPKQYDMFEADDDLSRLQQDVKTLTEITSNVRKGMFARHKKLEEADGHLLNLILDMQAEIYKLREMMIKEKK